MTTGLGHIGELKRTLTVEKFSILKYLALKAFLDQTEEGRRTASVEILNEFDNVGRVFHGDNELLVDLKIVDNIFRPYELTPIPRQYNSEPVILNYPIKSLTNGDIYDDDGEGLNDGF